MSYWVYLEKGGGPVNVPTHTEGGTYAVGGINKAEINITWNYSKYYYRHLDEEDGIRWLHGKVARDTIERLALAVLILGTERDDDYWASTPGNAGYALSILLGWAREYPDAEWRVS